MTKRRPKPKDPALIMAERIAARSRDLEAVGVPAELAALPSGETIEIIREGNIRDGKRVDHNVARRQDAFDALREGMAPGAYDAARRLEADLRQRRGEADKGRGIVRAPSDAGLCPLDRQISAGKRVDEAFRRIGVRDAWLLSELIYPSVERGGWRGTVAYITGEVNEHAQAAAVRSACANLAAAYPDGQTTTSGVRAA